MPTLISRRSPRQILFATLAAALACVLSQPGPHAQGLPPTGGFVESATSTDARPVLTPTDLQAFLPARGEFTFPAPYGTTGVRLTNTDDCGSGTDCVYPLGGGTWRNMSNSTNSPYLYVVLGLDQSNGGSGPTLFRYNKTTGETVNLGGLFGLGEDLRFSTVQGWYFSATLPTTLYITVDQQLRRFDVLTHASTVVLDVTSQFGDDKEIWQAHSSDDDRVHSFTLRLASNAEPLGCGVYREDTHQFAFYPAQGEFNDCQVDKSGNWLLIKEGADNRIVDVTLGTSTTLLDANGAGGATDLGFGAMLAADDHNALPNALRRWAFGPLTAGPVVYHDLAGQPSSFTQVSFTNARSAGFNEQFACGSAVNRTNGPRANEIVCVKLDGSLNTLVVAPVMTNLDAAGGGDDDAAKAPNGNLDPTGQYFLWTSNAMGGRLDAFLVRVPSGLLVNPPADKTAPAIQITAPLQSATVAGNANLSANATDDTGVAGVQFKLDGNNLGSEITTPSYAWSWNTATASDGVHVLTAVARDAAGNTAVSIPVSVTVLNTPAGPQITGVSASVLKQTRAFINWHTNQLADGQVEYGPTALYGSTTVLDAALTSSHLELLTGLTAGTTYHYRITSHNAQGTATTSGDFTFTTAAPLVLGGIAPSSLTGDSATIGWFTNQPASSQVEYGTTTGYGDANDFDESLVTVHSSTIGGLAPGTTYHYRVYSVTAAGVVGVSPDLSFTTPTSPSGSGPAAPGGFVESATSTDTRALVSSGTLQSLLPARGEFTLPAPYGTTAVRITNADDCIAGTDCVQAPGGPNWRSISNSTGSNVLYMVLGLDAIRGGGGPTLFRYNKTTGATANLGPLFAPGDDLRLSSGEGWYFSATLPTTYYITVDRQLRRYDVLTHASAVVFDIASQFGGDKEIWHAHSSHDDRVHSFTLRLVSNAEPLGCGVYREDTHQFSFYPAQGEFNDCQVDQSGNWLLIKEGADNRIVDLTLGTATTLLDADGAGGATDLGFGAMLAADDHNALPNALRRWGFGPLTAGPVVYHDLVGQPASFTQVSFTNARSAGFDQQFACGSAVNRTNGPRANEIVCVKLDGSLSTLVVAPVMTNLDAAGGGDDDAAKMPNGNLDPTGQYFLWTSNAMGGRLDAFLVRVPSGLLVTPPADITAPAVAITTPAQGATVSATVSLTASASDFVGVAGVQFKLDGVNLGTEITTAPYSWLWNTTTASDGVHVLTAVARDAAGNTGMSIPISVTVQNVAGGPQITGVSASVISQAHAFINWHTNQLADAQVEYGTTTLYGSATALDPSLVSSHLQLLSGLTGSTTYHYRVTSRNAQGAATTSGDLTFTTTPALVISAVAPSSSMGTSLVIGWLTNLPATSQVEYGLTTNYGDATDIDDAFVTVHAQTISNLLPGTTYHYRIYAVTAAGSVAITSDATFVTPSSPGGTGGSAPGGFVELATSTGTRAPVSAGTVQALLPARGDFMLPAPYGTAAVRLTNANDCSGTDCVKTPGGANWRNINNSSGSNDLYVVVGLDRGNGGGGPTLFRYNKTTGETANLGPLFDPGDDISWSTAAGSYFSARPSTNFYVPIDRQLRRYDVLTHAATVVFDTTAAFGDDKEIWQVHSSNDDRVHSFTLRFVSSGNALGCGVYREDVHQFSFYPAQGAFRECQVDKSGRWLLVTEGAQADQNRIIDLLNGSTASFVDANASGGDVDTGYGVLVALANSLPLPNALKSWVLGPLTGGPVVYQDPAALPRSLTYLSFANARSAPLDQQYACGSAVNRTNGPRANEIVCAKLDGSLNTLVVAPVMTDLDAPGGGDDAHKAPNGNLDPTGQFFFWTSNAMGGRLDAFLVKVPSALLVTPPSDITPPTIALTAPAQLVSVSGTVSVTAAASDFGGVAGVQLQLDGVALGAEFPNAPYAFAWDTTSTADGVHVLTAVARDAAGNTAMSLPVTITVLNTPGAPQISGVGASQINQSHALVSWQTNQLADAQIEYGTTVSYGSTTTLDPSLAASHMQLITGLASGTTYHYRVTSRNVDGVATASGDFTFTTASAPAILGVGTSSVIDVSAFISWTTDQAATSQVEYGLTTDYGNATDINAALVTTHGLTIAGLTPVTTYHFRVYSANAAGVNSVSADFTFTTSTYPVLSNVTSVPVDDVSATVTWTSDQPASTRVDYGLTSTYGQSTTLDSTMTLSHSQTIAGLVAGTTYHYRVRSANTAGLVTMSADATFTTRAPQAVMWTGLVNATVAGNVLQKAGGCNDCNDAGAGSQQVISAGDGYVQFTVTQTDNAKSYFIGLSNGNPGTTAAEIAYAMWQGDGVTIQEHGVSQLFFPVAVGDVLRIAVVNGVVKYSRNGTVVYTSTVAPTYPLQVDTTLRGVPSQVTGAIVLADPFVAGAPVFSGVSATQVMQTTANVRWTSDQAATAQVDYGLTSNYGTTLVDSAFRSAHVQAITGLAINTQYHYRVRSTNTVGLTTMSGDLTFTTLRTAVPVVWRDVVNATVAGNVLQKSGGCNDCDDAGAASQQTITSGNGYVEFTVTDVDNAKNYFIGLSNGNAGTTTSEIAYAMWQGDGVTIEEHGVWRMFFPVSVDDVLRIGVENGAVQYSLNGTVVYTSPVAPTYPLQVDTTLRGSTSKITNAVITANPVVTPPAISGVAVSDVLPTTATVRWTSDQAANARVDYGLTSSYGSTAPFDPTLRSAHTIGLTGLAAGTTYHFRVRSTNQVGLTTTSGDFTFDTLNPPHAVVWTDLVNATVAGNVLQKSGGCQDCDDAGAASAQSIDGGDGYVEFKVTSIDNAKDYYLGLSNGNPGTTTDEIAYAMWQGDGVSIKEHGVTRAFFPVAINDILRIAVVNGVVKYSKNGTVVYTSLVAPTYPLRVDTTLRGSTSTITNAVISTQPFSPEPVPVPEPANAGGTEAMAMLREEAPALAPERR